MQQIHRIPNVYASSGVGANSGSSGRGLETLANAAEVVSHMDTVGSTEQRDMGAARTSQSFPSGAALHLPISNLENSSRRNSRQEQEESSQVLASSDIDTYLDRMVSGQASESPVGAPPISDLVSGANVSSQGGNRTVRQREHHVLSLPVLEGGNEASRISATVGQSNLLTGNIGESVSEEGGSAVEIPESTSQSFLSSGAQDGTSEVSSFFESFLSRENEASQASIATGDSGVGINENLRNDPLLSMPELNALDDITPSSQPSDMLVGENTDRNSVDDNSSLTVHISEQSDVEENPARNSISGVGANLWENFENNTLNIEIPNMTPNSDDSSSFSGPMRTPRNSADVNRPQQPHQIPAFPTMGLIRPVSPMRNQSSPTTHFGYSSRTPSFARLLDSTLQMAQNNVLESSTVIDNGDSRSTPSEPSSYSQPGSLSGPSSLSPSLETDILNPTSDNNNAPSVVTSESVIQSSTANPSNTHSSLLNSNDSSRNIPRLDMTTSASHGDRSRNSLFSGLHSSGSSNSQQPHPTRGRNLMHLLETPFSVRGHERSFVPSDHVATNVPQPAAPSSFTLPLNARNHNVRSSSNLSSDRLSLLRNLRHNPPYCPSDCQVCQSTDGSPRPFPSVSRYSSSIRGRVNTTQSTAAAMTSARTESTARQPQRLASIIESEVRQAIDSIHARRISVSDTMRDLDNLQRNLGDVPDWTLEGIDEKIMSLEKVLLFVYGSSSFTGTLWFPLNISFNVIIPRQQKLKGMRRIFILSI